MKKIILIDTENVSDESYIGITELDSSYHLILFVSEYSLKFNTNTFIKMLSSNVNIKSIKVKRKHDSKLKNLMDFFIVDYLYEQIYKGNTFDEYHIISKDSDYDSWIHLFKHKFNLNINRGKNIYEAIYPEYMNKTLYSKISKENFYSNNIKKDSLRNALIKPSNRFLFDLVSDKKDFKFKDSDEKQYILSYKNNYFDILPYGAKPKSVQSQNKKSYRLNSTEDILKNSQAKAREYLKKMKSKTKQDKLK